MHFHFAAVAAFSMGQLISMLNRANLAVQNREFPTISTKREFFAENWVNFLTRAFAATAFVGLFVADPTMVEGWLGTVGVNITWQLPENIAARTMIAAIAGLGADFGLHYLSNKFPFICTILGEKSPTVVKNEAIKDAIKE